VTGRVVLIGGGPGDPDLITVRGLDRLLSADVVITDRLAPTSLLDRLGPDVELIDAARSPGMRTLSYDEIVELMVDRARAGKTVVRLKGGDPFVLAHGAQEVESCSAAGIPVEVVPGLTSATAAPVLAGVPLTSTEGAAGFTVVSGHLPPDDPASRLDWTAIARSGTTLVVLMGMRNLGAIAERLVGDGVPADTPAYCVADASLPSQRVVRSTLAGLAAEVARAQVGNPAVVIVETGGRQRSARRVLVLGGSRSGKSRFAETVVGGAKAVEYVATAARRADDAEWAERIRQHQHRRPGSWRTVETTAVAEHLAGPGPAVLVDSVTTWLAGAMDECGYWDDELSDVAAKGLAARIDRLCDAWLATPRAVVLVSDEVGSGVVPPTVAGRRFRDQLGLLNQRLAATSDEVFLVTAGIAQRLR
jgi:uroporphyrin-III C-methyltransferase